MDYDNDWCRWCLKKKPVHTMVDGLKVCDECCQNPVILAFYHCSECGTALPAPLARYAVRELSVTTCGSAACIRKREIRYGVVCCEKAEYTPCVCFRSYKCPDHHPNGVHIGTHD